MTEGIERFIRSELGEFGGYSAAVSPETLKGKVEIAPEDIVKLDANENPYGCSPRVARALAAYTHFNIYPDNDQTALRESLARYAGVSARHIVGGGGSNTLIDLVMRLFVGKGDDVLECVPTFGIYHFSAQLCGGQVIEVPRRQDFSVTPGMIRAALTDRTKLICLPNPNNPTGSLMSRGDLLEVVEMGVPLLLDEAYYEFSGETLASFVTTYPNLMVLRSLSKWAGLAGLRVGYGLFPDKIADYLLRIKMPYNVNVAALLAVEESLKDVDYLLGTVKKMVAERERLFDELAGLDWVKPYPSRANFILCRLSKGTGKDVRQQLQQRGILVRYFDTPRLKDCIRISVGKPEHTDAIVKALREIGKGM